MQTPARRCLHIHVYTWTKHPNSCHHGVGAWVGCSAYAQAPCAIWDALVYLTHPHRPGTRDSRTCRSPKPFCSRSWWPSRTSKDVQRALDVCVWAMVGTKIHVCWPGAESCWLYCSFQSYQQHTTSWCSLYIKQTSEFPPITHNTAPAVPTDIINGCNAG